MCIQTFDCRQKTQKDFINLSPQTLQAPQTNQDVDSIFKTTRYNHPTIKNTMRTAAYLETKIQKFDAITIEPISISSTSYNNKFNNSSITSTFTSILPGFLKVEQPFGYQKKELADASERQEYSFRATRAGKCMSYVPVISSFMAIYRFVQSYKDYRTATHHTPDSASETPKENTQNHEAKIHIRKRSVLWMSRSAIEFVPILGNISTLALDLLVETNLIKNPLDIPNQYFKCFE